jgi:hypothetical protein
MSIVLTGCAGGERPSVPPVSTSSVPSVYYTGLSGECPAVHSAEAKRFTGGRKGRLLPSPPQLKGVKWVDCGWRTPAGAPWVTVLVKIYWDGFAPTQSGYGNATLEVTRSFDHDASMAKMDESGAVRVTELTTPSGQASMQANGTDNSLSQSTAIGNVVVTVMLFETKAAGPGGARADELMAKLAGTTQAITSEIAGQLVTQR